MVEFRTRFSQFPTFDFTACGGKLVCFRGNIAPNRSRSDFRKAQISTDSTKSKTSSAQQIAEEK